MIGLSVIAAIAAWIFIGYLLWTKLVRPRIRWWPVRAVALLVLAAAWLIAPVADEILGAREFERLCKEMPEIKFYGPVPVGPGPFFEADGTPKWKDRNEFGNSDEFSAIKRNTKEWGAIFGTRDEWRILREWPMPVGESYSLDFDKRTGKPSVETYERFSPGGWIKRGLGWGFHAPYQCPWKGRFPRDEERIVFGRGTDLNSTKKDDVK